MERPLHVLSPVMRPVVIGLGAFASDLRNAGIGFGRPEQALNSYADPERINERPAHEMRVQVIGHHFGRRLTTWMETIGFAMQTAEQYEGGWRSKMKAVNPLFLPASRRAVWPPADGLAISQRPSVHCGQCGSGSRCRGAVCHNPPRPVGGQGNAWEQCERSPSSLYGSQRP